VEDVKQTNMNDWYLMHNKNVLVSLQEDRKVLNNGISVQDTKGRKDIVVGIVECSHPALKFPNRALIWFPMYAGLPMQLNGKQYLIVNYEDIIMSEKVSE
jgi:co-chaperonin GroES (HSP10)